MTKNIVRISAIVSALAMMLAAAPAFAGAPMHHSSNDVTVTNFNSAYVKNDVEVSASTGGNDANGGSFGFSNDGGMILTGDATAIGAVTNDVNYNETNVSVRCGWCGSSVDDVTVMNANRATVKNYVDVSAKTGYNDANGGNFGFGNDGGFIATGSAGAQGDVVSLVNTNITRIRR
jgi:hypothetical protein